MKKIVFVCSGNTCRSPMAEGICTHLAAQKGLDIKALSCGLAASEGDGASQNAILALKELYNIDISSHRSKSANIDDLSDADIIFTVGKRHADFLCSYFPQFKEKVRVFSPEISDPFMQSLEVYKSCAEQIYSQIKKFLEEK